MARMNRRTFLAAVAAAGAAVLGGARGALARFLQSDIDRIRREYLSGEVVVRDGWIMARSEEEFGGPR